MIIETLAHRILSALGALLVVLFGVGSTWLVITRKRPYYGYDDDLALPCTHPVRDFAIGRSSIRDGSVELWMTARCQNCGADRIEDFDIRAESDGRIVISNATSALLSVDVDGEVLHLEPQGSANPATHIMRIADARPENVNERFRFDN